MLFLIALTIAVLFSVLCAGALKKAPLAFYIGGTLISVLMIVLAQQPVENVILRKYVIGLFSRGALAGALWVVVMGMRVLPDGSKAIKRLMPVRGELSIFTATVTLSHIIFYGLSYIKRLTDPNFSKAADFLLTCGICAALVLIMVPLTVLSFKKIRKKMNAKKWKNIQRAAYVFYALIYLHIIALFIPKAKAGIEGYFLSCLVYTAVFGGYMILRVRKWYVKKKTPENSALLNIASTACAVLLTGIVAFCSYGKPQNKVRTNRPAAKKVTVMTVNDTSPTNEEDRTTLRLSADRDDTSSHDPGESSSPDSKNSSDSSSSQKDSSSSRKKDSSSGEEDTDEEEQDENHEEQDEQEEQNDREEQGEHKEQSEERKDNRQEEKREEQQEVREPVQTQPPVTEPPEPEFIYNNGTYEDSAYGYDGEVHVTITIENDVITEISAYSDEEEPDYFDSAYETVAGDILNYQTCEVDAVSGATYSSNAIMKAVKKCLEQARK
ncbi:FMN-binding protein [Ruminococcus albus]|uniref:Ferric reductase like transmembrane component n=1 Tax=Ruminococcus albus TaxID=1264 RepID=A0A1H7NLL9_RUMAL|nr:FMN-binding protein [Ruminococcus albus]SEL24450.1 Ferric reductase like transmembrane component [Ruminococcus albus]